MLYVLAFLFPPIAVLMCGRPLAFLVNLILCLCFWVPGVIHAFYIVNQHLQEKQTQQIVEAIEKNR
jgi:uncharacterized membrane protein YqaE (UPF0057 family)